MFIFLQILASCLMPFAKWLYWLPDWVLNPVSRVGGKISTMWIRSKTLWDGSRGWSVLPPGIRRRSKNEKIWSFSIIKHTWKWCVNSFFERRNHERSTRTEERVLFRYNEDRTLLRACGKVNGSGWSAINALDHHGLDRCPDHGIYGFERYVALGIVGRNLQRLGAIIMEKELKALKRREKLRLAA